MNTIVLKWNPAFSSFSMIHYLEMIEAMNLGGPDAYDMNWSVWDYGKIHKGDRFYFVKLGYGQEGIVGGGVVTSDPYEGQSWTRNGKTIYYVDILPKLLINPDSLPILTSLALSHRVPSFEWFRGHSGLVLTETETAEVDRCWSGFLAEHKEEFSRKAADRDFPDRIYWEGMTANEKQ